MKKITAQLSVLVDFGSSNCEEVDKNAHRDCEQFSLLLLFGDWRIFPRHGSSLLHVHLVWIQIFANKFNRSFRRNYYSLNDQNVN